jgi:PTS system nitrogen regulatory IIA component
MEMNDVLRSECIEVAAAPVNKKQALELVAASAKKSPVLYDIDEKELLKALKEREKVRSTGMENGIAIPHCRLKNISDFVVGIVCIPEGVAFETIDKKLVNLMVYIVAPEEATNEHIKLLSGISRTLGAISDVNELAQLNDPERVKEAFLAKSPVLEPNTEIASRGMVKVIVNDRDIFDDILKILAGFESCSLVVEEVKTANTYLTHIPLFATFAGDFPDDFCQCIIAVVNRKLVNEVIREIDKEVGGLQEQTNVLLFVEELTYCAGHIAP